MVLGALVDLGGAVDLLEQDEARHLVCEGER